MGGDGGGGEGAGERPVEGVRIEWRGVIAESSWREEGAMAFIAAMAWSYCAGCHPSLPL